MKTYNVQIPITGILSVTVRADNEDEAKQKALEMPYDKDDHDLQWECTEQVVKGNVCYAMLNNIDVEECGDDSD